MDLFSYYKKNLFKLQNVFYWIVAVWVVFFLIQLVMGISIAFVSVQAAIVVAWFAIIDLFLKKFLRWNS